MRNSWILLALISWLAVAPMLARTGTNIVTQTYERAADHFWAGEDPYQPPNGKGDWFKYSPFFAAAYGLFAALPDVIQALTWAALNALIFWYGLSRWFRWERATHPLIWIATAVTAMELDTSLRYQQINALMAGVLLVALAEMRDQNKARAARWIALDTNLKLLPGFFAALLLIPGGGRYFLHLVIFSLELLLLPIVRLGWHGCWQAHLHWVQTLMADMGAPGLLDIHSVLARMDPGLGSVGRVIQSLVLPITLTLLAHSFRKVSHFSWGLFYTLGAAALLLFSPRTESPTFVLLAPAYLFLMSTILGVPGRERAKALVVWGLLAFAGTVAYTDLWPKAIWDPRATAFASKTLAALGIYLFTLWGFRRSPAALFSRR